MEIWRDVVGYEDYFQVSNTGKVFSKRTSRILKYVVRRNGYCTVATKIGGRNGKSLCFKIHRIVAEAFLSQPSKEMLEEAKNCKYGVLPVNHKDGNKLNNYASNLEWATSSDNIKHAYKIGLLVPLKGERNVSSKLTQEQVIYIRKVYKPRNRVFGARALARELKVSHRTVLSVVNFSLWK